MYFFADSSVYMLTLPEEDGSIFFPGRRIFGWIALAEMMDSCYMNPHGASSFLSPWNLARQEENDGALPDSSLKKTPSLPIALIWNSVISHKSQVDNSSEGLGVPTQLSAPGGSNHFMSFQQSGSMLMMMTTDQSLFHLLKQYLVLTRGCDICYQTPSQLGY